MILPTTNFGSNSFLLSNNFYYLCTQITHQCQSPEAMTEETLRSYHLTSLEEPTDEMLHAIMEKVAKAARESTKNAEAKKKEMLRIAIENANHRSIARA